MDHIIMQKGPQFICACCLEHKKVLVDTTNRQNFQIVLFHSLVECPFFPVRSKPCSLKFQGEDQLLHFTD